MNKKIVILTNIPTPYRSKLFDLLCESNITVIYCAEVEPDRLWTIPRINDHNNYILKKSKQIKGKNGFYFHLNFEIFKVLNKIKPEILIITSFNPTNLIAIFWAFYNKGKLIYWTDGTLDSETKIGFIRKLIRKFLFRKFSSYICTGLGGKKLLKNYGVSNNKIFYSNLCVDNKLYQFHKYEDREFDILYCGRIVDRKLPRMFADICNEVNKIRKIRVHIIGDGECREELLNLLKTYSVDFYYSGFVQSDQLVKLYGTSKILLLTSEFDAWGLVANEALASGTPVIISNKAGAANDLVANDINGYVLGNNDIEEWRNKALKILNNKHLWHKMSSNGVQIVNHFNYDSALKGIVDSIKILNR